MGKSRRQGHRESCGHLKLIHHPADKLKKIKKKKSFSESGRESLTNSTRETEEALFQSCCLPFFVRKNSNVRKGAKASDILVGSAATGKNIKAKCLSLGPAPCCARSWVGRVVLSLSRGKFWCRGLCLAVHRSGQV